MSWLRDVFTKDARQRRFRAKDKVRYFTDGRRGHNKVVLSPRFERGVVLDWDPNGHRYNVQNETGDVIQVHPQNIVHDHFYNPALDAKVELALPVEVPPVSVQA
jgi:hypothetical protein